jgi:phosphohistidine phosphatase
VTSRTRRLHLLRHAKSGWDDPALADRDRPLSPRGRAACAALARHLGAARFTVDLVLCSPAVRTRLTWAGVRPGVAGDPEVRVVDAIYEATAAELLAVVRGVEDVVGSVLMVGHNPGTGDLATALAGSGEEAALTSLYAGYPTGGLADLSFAGGWSGLEPGAARLDGFVRPRELG